MTRLHWSDHAVADLERITDFLAVRNVLAAERAVKLLLSAPQVLTANPALGARVEKLAEHDVRRLVVGAYEVRYRVSGDLVEILRVFHTREKR